MIRHASREGVPGPRFIDGLMTSDDGPVYSLHGRRFIAEMQIDEYQGAASHE
jgi:hypothetical protein